MTNLFLSIYACGTAILSIMIVGTAVLNTVSALNKIKIKNEWALAPIFGVSAIILICQNLVYVGFPIKFTGPILLFVCIALNIIYIKYNKNIFYIYKNTLLILILSISIYLLNGIALLILGPDNYFGYGWVDLFNYVAQAQFFLDQPFHSPTNNIEYLNIAQYYKNDRIGQSVLHAFISSINGLNAQQNFGPTILLSPLLTFMVFVIYGDKFDVKMPFKVLIPLFASSSTAIATIHLECFFSQSLVFPFFALWPIAISYLIKKDNLIALIFCSTLLAVISAIYTEILPIALAIMILAFIFHYFLIKNPHNNFRIIVVFLITIISSILLNIGFSKTLWTIISRTNSSNFLREIYPWAQNIEGLSRLWLGNQIVLNDFNKYFYFMISLIVIIIIFIEIINFIFVKQEEINFLILSICLIPAGLYILNYLRDGEYSYQSYKLLLTIWPICLFYANIKVISLLSKFFEKKRIILLQLLLITFSAFCTIKVVASAAYPKPSYRGESRILMEDSFVSLRAYLNQIKNQNIFLWWHAPEYLEGNWRGRWITYFARDNTIWNMTPAPASGAGLGSYATLPILSSETNGIGISSTKISSNASIKTITNNVDSEAIYHIYQFSNADQIREIDSKINKAYIKKIFEIHPNKKINQQSWYPIWTAGKEGDASIISVKFEPGKIIFRYDHWGYPESTISFFGDCVSQPQKLELSINNNNHVFGIKCNSEYKETNIPAMISKLQQSDTLGTNEITRFLGGKEPIANIFPGKLR